MKELTEILSDPQLIKWIYLGLWIVAIYIVAKLIKKTINKLVSNNSTRYSFKKFVNFFGYLVFGIAVMIIFNYDVSSVTLALGVTGAGIAFALQEVIMSIAGFLAVLFGDLYKVGDRVQLGGIKGDIIDVGVLRTTVMEIGDWVNGDLYNGKMVRIANSFIFKEPVYNYSGNFPFLWDEIEVKLKHTSDIQYANGVFYEILHEELGDFTSESKAAWSKLTKELYIEKAQIEPMISLTWDENWITFTLRYIVDFKKRRGTKNVLFTKILAAIRDSNDRLQIASSAVEITMMK